MLSLFELSIEQLKLKEKLKVPAQVSLRGSYKSLLFPSLSGFASTALQGLATGPGVTKVALN